MKITKQLNQEEIERIIAEYFQADEHTTVSIKVHNELRGYGPMEEETPVVTCEIESNESF